MSSLADQLAAAIAGLVADAINSGELAGTPPESITLERPKNRDHGDYATSIALQLAKAAGKNPREVATLLQGAIAALPGVSKVDIAGPGFINITLDRANQAELVRTILSQGEKYGEGRALNGTTINLEFISANPTGPLHLGHTRWAAVGDALGRCLKAAGATVVQEFYLNDRGRQMDLFGQSVQAAAQGLPIPEDGYQGDYIKDLASEVLASNPGISTSEEFREAAYKVQLAQQQRVLDTFRTHFDIWFSERSLHDSGAVEHGIKKLREQGHVFEEAGALWLRTTDFGDDKDRVLIKENGELT
ncbi:MAG: hypothetical protein RLZZ364_338, partial [Actinomycetota bacterium]